VIAATSNPTWAMVDGWPQFGQEPSAVMTVRDRPVQGSHSVRLCSPTQGVSHVQAGRIRKTIVAALGSVITVVLLIPEESLPERWRPVVGIVLALGTIAGVYRVRNDRPVSSRRDLIDHVPTRAASPEERPRRKPPTTNFP
jgi:hypothetical protein